MEEQRKAKQRVITCVFVCVRVRENAFMVTIVYGYGVRIGAYNVVYGRL